MKAIRLPLFIGLLVFLLSFLYQIPASFVLSQVEKRFPIQFKQVTGTLWSASVEQVHYQGIDLGELNWHFHWLSLLTGKVGANIHWQDKGFDLQSYVAITLDQTVLLEDAELTLDAYWLKKIPKMPANFEGVLSGTMTKIEWQSPAIPLLIGELDWQKGGVLTPIRIPPGNYHFSLHHHSNQQQIDVSSKEAAVKVSGHLKLLEDWQYKINLHLKPTVAVNPGMRQGLTLLGKAQPDGMVVIKKSGNFNKM